MVRFLALVTIVLVSLRIAGVDFGAVALGASVTAVIIGLAAQQTVGNILAGFVLISTHPFQVGDRVRFNGFGMDVEGTVAAHGLLHLTLTDGEDTVKIPNNTALTMSIRPLREPAAVDMRTRLPLGIDPEEIERSVSAAITVPTKDAPHVALEEFDGSDRGADQGHPGRSPAGRTARRRSTRCGHRPERVEHLCRAKRARLEGRHLTDPLRALSGPPLGTNPLQTRK